MMNSRLVKILMILAITSLVAACKLAVIVVEGGKVESEPGTCWAGTICVNQVNDTNYHESFLAVAKPGWVFERWNSGGGFFCAPSTHPFCTLSLAEIEGNEAIEALVASDKTFYIMPIFVRARPVTDTATVDGKEWLQPADFIGYTYNQVSMACPASVCSGTLFGSAIDLTGYTWASIEDVSALFNAYGLDPPFTGPFQERRGDYQAYVAASQDFESTDHDCSGGDCPVTYDVVAGLVRDHAPSGELPYTPYFRYLDEANPGPYPVSFYNTRTRYTGSSNDGSGIGVWFWRPITSE
jgi:hypothetical protein